jgi:hypothetical protein
MRMTVKDFSNGRLFNEVDMAKHPQATRLSIYTLIDSMMKKQRKGIPLEDNANHSIKETRQTVYRGIRRFNDG